MDKNSLVQISANNERDLLFALCQDYKNYKKIHQYLDVNDFHVKEYQEIFILLKRIYDNSGYRNITSNSIESFCFEKNIDKKVFIGLASFVEFSQDSAIDFDGTYNQFRRLSGIQKMNEISEKYGGMDNLLYQIYNKYDTTDDIKKSIDNLTKSCFKTYKTSTRRIDLSSGMLDYVQNKMFYNDGQSIHFIHGHYLMEYYSKGIHVGVTFIGGQSGSGKTSITIPFFGISILESGQKLLGIFNEQDESEIRQLFLFAYISRVKKDTKGLLRQNFNADGRKKITDEQFMYLCQCAKEFEERYDGRLEFVFIPRFNEYDLENLIEEYARLGYKNVLLDTFKQEDSEKGWEGMDNLAKKMDGLAKDLELKIVCTIQLSANTSWRKYLTVSCIGKAKSVKEVATSLWMFRWLRSEEIPNIKYSCFNRQGDKIVWSMDNQLQSTYKDSNGQTREKKYIAIFNDKQRKSECGQVIIYEADLGSMFFKEVGVTNSIKNDDNGR